MIAFHRDGAGSSGGAVHSLDAVHQAILLVLQEQEISECKGKITVPNSYSIIIDFSFVNYYHQFVKIRQQVGKFVVYVEQQWQIFTARVIILGPRISQIYLRN